MSAPRFMSTYCSQCGGEFGPGESGYSNCYQHMHSNQRAHMVCTYCGDPMRYHDNDQPVCCCGELHFVTEAEFVQMLATIPEPCEVDAAGTFKG